MKKRILIIAACLFFFGVALSSTGHCGPYPYRYGRCCGGCGYSDGWGWAAAIFGGILAAGIIGNIIASQNARPPGTPQSQGALVYAEPGTAYAYPDPAFIAKYGTKQSQENSSGEWVLVPGQRVNGVWVEEHRVRIDAAQQ